MTDYKYNCSTIEYLRMESGLLPVPEDSKDSYIVVEPAAGDLGLVEETKEYKFNGSDWEFVKEVENCEDRNIRV